MIERNFAIGKGGHLFSLRYQEEYYEDDEEHELRKFLRLWQDPEFLVDFAEKHRDDLRSGFYGNLGFEYFITQTGLDAKNFIRKIDEAADKDSPDELIALFAPLDDRPHERENYEQLKAKGTRRKSWLRLYALQTRDDKIYIVGGAIKLVHKMEDREHLEAELDRLIAVRKELSAYKRDGRLVELTIQE